MGRPSRKRIRLQPRKAMAAVRQLIRDPEDTEQVFRIIEALSGSTLWRVRNRLRGHPHGRQLLEQNRDLLSVLLDREALAVMPEGSLGRAYLAFVEAEGITADGLVAASKSGSDSGRDFGDPEVTWVGNRLRDSHDLWHVVSGYHGDIVGEGALLAFTMTQTRNPAIAFIVLAAALRGLAPGIRREMLRGLLRGLRSRWLPAVDWEALLPLPLDECRTKLRLGDPPRYQPVRPQASAKAGNQLEPA